MAERGQDDQSSPGDLVSEVAEHEERRLVGPMDVVEDHDQSGPLGRAAHRCGHVLEHAEPVLRRLHVAGQDGAGVESEGPEHLPPRPERRRPLRLHAASPHHRRPAGQGDPGQLLGQPGLADARLAGAEDEPTDPLAGGIEPGPQRVELTTPSDDAVGSQRVDPIQPGSTGPPVERGEAVAGARPA